LFTGVWPNDGMDYRAHICDAQQCAANAVRDNDRKFWMNIARCWLNLLEQQR